jgi:hypothetical protein
MLIGPYKLQKSIMKKIIFNWLRKNTYTSNIAAFWSLRKARDSYLNSVGWFDSFYQFMPVNNNGAAIPWYTYSAIDFLEGRIEKTMTVFEYGSGNSTIWWAEHVKKIVSCEHDQKWFNKLKPDIPENVEYTHIDLSSPANYETAALKNGNKFDVIVIDGRNRVNCARSSLVQLKDNGVVIWDNSDRKEYEKGYQFLLDNGFRRLDFTGMGPINGYAWCTSVFYRAENCLGI